MRHGIFHQRQEVCLHGFLQLGPGAQRHAPGLGQGNATLSLQEVSERKQPTALLQDTAPQAPSVLLIRRQIVLGPFGKRFKTFLIRFRHGFHLEGYIRIQRAHMQVLGIGKAAAPVRALGAKLHGIQVFDGRCHLRHLESTVAQLGHPLQHYGRDGRRGMHAFEPAEAAVFVAAGEDLLKKGFLDAACGFARNDNAQPGSEKGDVPGLGEGQDVLALGHHMGRDSVPDHIQNGDFLQRSGRCRQVHELGAQALQQGVPVHAVQQHGGMGLRKGLGRRVHGHGHLDGVGEFGGLE